MGKCKCKYKAKIESVLVPDFNEAAPVYSTDPDYRYCHFDSGGNLIVVTNENYVDLPLISNINLQSLFNDAIKSIIQSIIQSEDIENVKSLDEAIQCGKKRYDNIGGGFVSKNICLNYKNLSYAHYFAMESLLEVDGLDDGIIALIPIPEEFGLLTYKNNVFNCLFLRDKIYVYRIIN